MSGTTETADGQLAADAQQHPEAIEGGGAGMGGTSPRSRSVSMRDLQGMQDQLMEMRNLVRGL